MVSIWSYTLVSVVFVSLLSLLAIIVLWLKPKTLQALLHPLISLAVGGLFGDAFLHLIPESFEKSRNTTFVSLLVLAGL
ncbi:MAG TPA: ZIP family metal transporter, partial [bacterium]|nr:ZIP family metal transporter [bacterium]